MGQCAMKEKIAAAVLFRLFEPEIKMKLVKDGKVAVVYSPDFGGGWSTWHDVDPMDSRMAEAVISGDKAKMKKAFVEMSGESEFLPDFEQLRVAWLPVGQEFRINEYDGHESIQLKEDIAWFTA